MDDLSTRTGPVLGRLFGVVPAQARGPRAAGPPGPVEECERPSSARVWDYLLGGTAHGAVDRALGEELKRIEPETVELAHEARAFLRRAVRFLLDAGIDQFLDLGSGIPTMGHVHEVIARSGPGARVAYTDVDSIAAAQGSHLLARVPAATYTVVDVRDVDTVLAAPGITGLLDLRRPVGLLAVSVLHHVREDAAGLVADYLARLAPGSALALTHYTPADVRSADVEDLLTAYPHTRPRARTRAAVADLLAPVDLVEPGMVRGGDWRPEPGSLRAARPACGHWAGVGFRR